MNAPDNPKPCPLVKPKGDRCGVYLHEIHAEIAEYRLRHDGETSPELLAYIVGCGLEGKRL